MRLPFFIAMAAFAIRAAFVIIPDEWTKWPMSDPRVWAYNCAVYIPVALLPWLIRNAPWQSGIAFLYVVETVMALLYRFGADAPANLKQDGSFCLPLIADASFGLLAVLYAVASLMFWAFDQLLRLINKGTADRS